MDGRVIELGFALRRSEWRSARAFRIREAMKRGRVLVPGGGRRLARWAEVVARGAIEL